jgi:uncharacterized protein (TIGR02453 family)
MSDFFLKPALDFLSELEQNNRRDWFEEHRPAYEAARERFETFVNEVIDRFRAVEDLGPISARDCTMRIYRDVRFSKDKSPYRANMGASIARGGRHSARLPYYLHLAPHDGSFLAGGLYMPAPEQLTRFRDLIAENAAPFKRIVSDERFCAYFGEVGGERLKRAPAGFAPDHPDIELLRLKQILVDHPLSDADLASEDIAGQVVAGFTLMKPLIDYLNETVVA